MNKKEYNLKNNIFKNYFCASYFRNTSDSEQINTT